MATTPSRARTRYRKYLRDASAPIPRSTLLRHKKIAARSQEQELSPCTHSSLAPTVSPVTNLSSPPMLSTSSCSSSSQTSPMLSTSSSSVLSSPSSSFSPSSPSSFSSPTSTHSSPLSPRSPPAEGSSVPLYTNSDVTVFEAMCAIMQFCTSFKLSYSAIGALLSLIIFLCPKPNLVPSSFFKLKTYFKKWTHVHTRQKVCLSCHEKKEDCMCSGDHSTADLIHLDIEKAVETVLSRHSNSLCGLQQELSSNDEDSLRDVWDGSILRKEASSGRLSDGNTLALSLSTDGVSVFRSSTVSLWPVFLVILNLPAALRNNAQNVILAALWIGSTKPKMNLLLEPLKSQISKLRLTTKTSEGLKHFKATILMGIFDLPAKAAVLCMKQFNGQYGCSVCLHPGKRVTNHTQTYPPETVYSDRTHYDVMNCATKAQASHEPVRGILGVSPLTSMLNLVDSIPIDYMHAVLEGVTRWLTKSWFDSANHQEAYYLGRSLAVLDAELLKQKPPHEFSRPPRSVRKHLAYWKASELRTWLLYYSLPLLLDYLPSLYWHHYALLVCAMHILLQNRLPQAQVNAAEQMLIDFCLLLPELYGPKSCTANAHQLLHLAKYVRCWGPLWTHSLFGFENKNGHLKTLFHGKAQILDQIIFNVDVSYALQLNLCPEIDSHRSNMTKISLDSYRVGNVTTAKPTSEQASALNSTQSMGTFLRMFRCGVIYHCRKYPRA